MEAQAPSHFYQYCSISSQDRRDWLKTLLVDRSIYFRSRSQLNDLRELRPRIVLDGTNTKLRAFVQDQLERDGVARNRTQRRDAEDDIVKAYRRDPKLLEKSLHGLLDRTGLLCVSESPTVELMWSHYADGNRGVCIEFDARAGLFNAAQRVSYGTERPQINPLTATDQEIVERSLFVKQECWGYEKEWRIVALPRHAQRAVISSDGPLEGFLSDQHGPGYYALPVGSVTKVITGIGFPETQRPWLQDLLDRTAIARAAVRVARNHLLEVGPMTKPTGRRSI